VALFLVGGGARSGKSRFALARARALGRNPAFVATAVAIDDEMRARISRHRQERHPILATFEEPTALVARLQILAESSIHDVAVVECLTTWITNLLVRGDADDAIEAEVGALSQICSGPFSVVLVTNEVGMGIVPEHPLGRRFRDLVGRAHQRLAADASEIHFAVLGQMLRLRPGPLALAATETVAGD
jgi:adenosylcobinamide kinase/adenosylcobinamide-phosphate guanylyltransferase